MKAIFNVTLSITFALAMMPGYATDGKEAPGKAALALTDSAKAADPDCDNIGSDLSDLLVTIDSNQEAIAHDKPGGLTMGGRLKDAHDKVAALQKILQPAGAKPNDPVLYSYAVNVQAVMGDTVVILMDVRARMMGTVGNQTGPGGASVPGNSKARAHYDLITLTIAKAEKVMVKGGHCYMNYGH